MYSCTQKEARDVEIISINPTFNFSENAKFFEKIDTAFILPLETNEKCMIGTLSNVIIAKDRIIIYDEVNTSAQVSVFDMLGRFQYSIPTGNGPEEIRPVTSVSYNRYEDLIIVHQLGNKLSHFTLDGKFVRYDDDISCWPEEVVATADGYLLKINEYRDKFPTEESDCLVLQTDMKFNIENEWIPRRQGLFGTSPSRCMQYSGDNILVTSTYNDTIYEFSNENGLVPKYALEYPNRMPEEYIHEGVDKSKLNYNLFNGDMLDNGTHQYFYITNRIEGSTQVFRDKKDGKTMLTHYKYQENREQFVFLMPSWKSEDGYFINTIHMYEQGEIDMVMPLLSDRDKTMLKNTTADDNPVLLFYRLKEF